MSSEAQAVVREFLDLVAAGDLDDAAKHLDPEVVGRGTKGGLDERGISHGAGPFVDYLREVLDNWERFDVKVERLIELDETVVAFVRETGRATHGGLEVHNETAILFKLHQLKIVESRGYLDREEALRAAGWTG